MTESCWWTLWYTVSAHHNLHDFDHKINYKITFLYQNVTTLCSYIKSNYIMCTVIHQLSNKNSRFMIEDTSDTMPFP